MERTRTTRRSRRGTAALLATVGLVVSACGSDTTDTTTANAPAGAKENAVGDAVCYDWPAGTVAKPCAIDLKGPGGGRIFYDAGTTQPWGRFLEVAPQNWNGTLYKCPGSGAIGSSCEQPKESTIPEKTGDFGQPDDPKRDEVGKGYHICRFVLSEEIIQTRSGIGDGRVNTEELYNDQRCTNGETAGITLAKNYRGGGLADWYIPSEDELHELCTYTKRLGIGGFPAKEYYHSSTLVDISVRALKFDANNCEQAVLSAGPTGSITAGLIRPIRAF